MFVCVCVCVCVCLCVLWVTRDQHLNPHPNKGPVTDGWKLHAGILRPFVRELFCGPMRGYQIRFHSNKDQQIYRADRLPKQCHTNNAKWDLMSTHTHTHAHCCPTSEHLLKFCTLKFMLKEKFTCLLKHSGRAVKWRLLLFWSHDLSVFLKSTGKHHTHIPLSRLVLTHTHTKHKPLVTPTLVVVVVHIKQLHLALSQGRIHSHTISRKYSQTHTLNYFNSTLELVHNRFLTCTNELKKPAMPHAPLQSIISCSLYTKFRKHTRVLTYY